ncbi:MAG: Asp-tRNA(Asn)/Glu-tRNA(Gln) amidotransferase GatCAB subunit A [Gammaproteobacteria bacterium]|nr:Asp-tRNA(Asn)/Glu-tRNA(Gln) amidotransferase GatCAB subunit A [Gammaproteobacteria bacterium]HJM59129.1 Asp-tRNA(Asn)/Glu-tRNA(Gln) amidotransferase subunit GatA [SAR86 cluster bacterium]|tara:strand:- start:1654 stop:3108 length:1455 start_codon:yes stop_codon:yes gene_type:complete
MKLHELSLKEQLNGLIEGSFSSTELTEHYLNRISNLDKDLNSYITVTADLALQQAALSDERYKSSKALPLDGIPIAHKDIFCTEDVLTTCGSKMLSNFKAPYSSTVVNKLSSEGVVILGKTNMDEFAMGSSNETSFFGPVKNPWNKEYVPGGSSGGSAACVSAQLASAATATDTGGSIRQPAALCGLTGIKPTYGRVSRYGMIAFASSLDQGGVLARSAEDSAILLESMSGHDPKDSTSLKEEVPSFLDSIDSSINGIKIGLPKEFFERDLPEYVESSTKEAIETYKNLGAEIHEISLPNVDLSLPVYYIIAPAECSANLSRYDGVRYGYRCEDPKDIEDLYMRTREEGFGSEVKRRVLIGTYALSAGYYDAYYLKAQKCRRLVANDFSKAFESVDVILSPTTPGTSFKSGEKSNDPIEMYLQDIFTIPANLAGLPGISFPCGNHDGLPLGVQLVGNSLQEAKLLQAAHQFQKVTDWHNKFPEV